MFLPQSVGLLLCLPYRPGLLRHQSRKDLRARPDTSVLAWPVSAAHLMLPNHTHCCEGEYWNWLVHADCLRRTYHCLCQHSLDFSLRAQKCQPLFLLNPLSCLQMESKLSAASSLHFYVILSCIS